MNNQHEAHPDAQKHAETEQTAQAEEQPSEKKVELIVNEWRKNLKVAPRPPDGLIYNPKVYGQSDQPHHFYRGRAWCLHVFLTLLVCLFLAVFFTILVCWLRMFCEERLHLFQ